jgi:regulatory protein
MTIDRTESEKPGGTAARPPGRVTEAYLQRAALAYLERFASSAETLRRVLRRKVDKRCRARDEDPAEFGELVDAVVAQAVSSGLVDDTRYAEGRAATLRRRGGSARVITAKLAAKGVDRAVIEAALQGGPEDEELVAAHALARRRRIGPYRGADRAAFRARDLGVLARAGFSFDIARQVVDGEPPD